MNQKLRNSDKYAGIGLASSLIVLLGALTSQAVFAQDDATQADTNALVEEVVVQGTRANLQNAQDLKRESDTFVDAISAEDIGSLPDRSVLEAIQRLPGVSVERFQGPDDPDHFSVEGSGAVIRGMTQTRSEFNGRDSFTANSGRGLNFQDVPPELMGGVDVYKNQTADMIEGGIGGTISLRTRKPFDQDGRQMAFTMDYSYGDLAQDWSPSLSGLFSDRWETSAGEFGLLVSIAGSQLFGESHGIQSDAYSRYDASYILGAERFTEGLNADETAYVWMPNSGNLTMKEDDRTRKGASIVGQWLSPDDSLQVTGEYIRSDSELDWKENSLKYQGSYPKDPTNVRSNSVPWDVITFDDGGMFETGTFNFVEWRGNSVNPQIAPSDIPFGPKVQSDIRIQDTHSLVEDFSLNVEWQATDNLELSADYQYIKAESEVDDLQLMLGLFAGQTYDITGDTPKLTYQDPWYGYRTDHPDEYTDAKGFGDDPEGDANYFQDPNNYFWRSEMDHYERSEGESAAIRFDGTYHFDEGFVRSIMAGVRFADREQLVNRSGYAWTSVAPEWGDKSAGWLTDPDYADQSGDYEYVDWSDFQRGGVFSVPGDLMIHPTEKFARDLMGNREDRVRELILNDKGEWDTKATANRENVDSRYGLFSPGEINYTREKNQAVYVRLDFGGDDELRYSGNIGLRYAKVKRTAEGAVVFGNLNTQSYPPASVGDLPLTGETARAYLDQMVANGTFDSVEQARKQESMSFLSDERNYLSRDDLAFFNDQELPASAKKDTEVLLPSFNVKVEMTSDVIARFALAKAAAYPDISDVTNRLTLGILNYGVNTVRYDYPDSDPNSVYNGMIESAYVPGWTASGGNPYLEPMMSTQYDLALEWYFSDVGQLTGTIFHKNLSNYFVKGSEYQYITNPTSNVTRLVDIDSTVNGGKAKMDGFELAYQQFYEGIFENFGTQVTYTYIDASGVPNNDIDFEEAVANANADDNPDNDIDYNTDTGIRVTLDNVPLQGQSKHTVNLVGMFETDDWSVRLAYNWRSKYLLTTRDVISKAPLWFDDRGQLDGSVFYNLNDQIQLGMQATNLMDTQSKTLMQLDDGGLQAGRSWFIQDRRIAFVVKGTF